MPDATHASSGPTPAGWTIPDGPWLMMPSGRPFPLLTPRQADVDFAGIAAMLARTARFRGATATAVPYTVAQHSVHVAALVPAVARPYALLHDAHEAPLGDRATPVKDALRLLNPAADEAWRALVAGIDRAVTLAAGLTWPWPHDIAAAVKHADLVMLATERRDLMPAGPGRDIDLPAPAPETVRPLAEPDAEMLFVFHLNTLCPGLMPDTWAPTRLTAPVPSLRPAVSDLPPGPLPDLADAAPGGEGA